MILATEGIEGVTFTGGEPFAQARALAQLAQRVRTQGLSVFLFTGYELPELTQPQHRELLALADVVVTGRFIDAKRTSGAVWRGSTNQEVHFLSRRYGPESMLEAGAIEFHLGSGSAPTITGFPVDDSWRYPFDGLG